MPDKVREKTKESYEEYLVEAPIRKKSFFRLLHIRKTQKEEIESEAEVKRIKTKRRYRTYNKAKRSPKTSYVLICILLVVLVFGSVSYAWYVLDGDREAYTEAKNVMVPYYLYLVNDEKTESAQLSIDSMYPGETKRAVICVSNMSGVAGSGIALEDDLEYVYEVGLAYTQNMPLVYTLYELVTTNIMPDESEEYYTIGLSTDDTSDDIYLIKKKCSSNTAGDGSITALSLDTNASDIATEVYNKEMYGNDWQTIVNRVQYDIYTKGTMEDGMPEAPFFKLTAQEAVNGVAYDFYLIEIDWKENTAFHDYIKETDLIYVNVKTVQPKPE